jgi:phage major head subunit gpT-like protein
MANVIIHNYVSADAKRALEQFRADFRAAFMQDTAEQWARDLGVTIKTDALKVTLPVPISAAGYIERKGDRVFRRLAEKSFSFSARMWQDGFAEFAEIVEAPDFIGFGAEPQAMAAAASQLMNEIIAAKLIANAVQDFDGKAYFATDHPINVASPSAAAGKVFSNLITGTGTNLTAANVGVARKNFRNIKGPNGKPLGVRLKGIAVPPALEETARQISLSGLIVNGNAAVDNIERGLRYWVVDQLGADSDIKWYPIGEKTGMYPWALVDRGGPKTLVLDKTSAMYEREGKIGLASELEAEGSLCFPQLVQSWAGTAP